LLLLILSSCLIINYSFPPHPGVGGRRWAKLAKYMAISGTQVHVINASGNSSSWQADVEHANIFIHSISNVSEIKRNRFVKKMLFLVAKQKTKGNYADQSLWWNARAYQLALQLITEHEIQHVIASCPPYHLLSHFINLKSEFPHIIFTADYRDLWIELQEGKGFFSHLSKNRFLAEREKERLVLMQADYIITVSDEMTEAYEAISRKKNCYTISNGYDESDFELQLDQNFISQFVMSNRINILFAGSLVEDSNVYAKPFFEALFQLKKENLKQYQQLNIQVIGQLNAEIKKLIEDGKLDIVKINPSLPSQQVCSLYKYFDYLLLFLIPYYRFAFISKFFDYLPARKPILAITEPGSFSTYLEKNQLGWHVLPGQSLELLLKLTKGPSNFNRNFNYEHFSYQYLAKQYESIIFS
jgi:glycosyltransferase involved in cell wall biosynthesis